MVVGPTKQEVVGDALDLLIGSWGGVAQLSGAQCQSLDKNVTRYCCADAPVSVDTFMEVYRDENALGFVNYGYRSVIAVNHSTGFLIFQPIHSWVAPVVEAIAINEARSQILLRVANTIDSFFCAHVTRDASSESITMSIPVKPRYSPALSQMSTARITTMYWCQDFWSSTEAGGCEPRRVWPAEDLNMIKSVLEDDTFVNNVVRLRRITTRSEAANANPLLGIMLPCLAGLTLLFCFLACLAVVLRLRRKRRLRDRRESEKMVEVTERAKSNNIEVFNPCQQGEAEVEESSTSVELSTAVWQGVIGIVMQGLQEHWLIDSADITMVSSVVDKGGFGEVRVGMLYHSNKVAIKTCKDAGEDQHARLALANEMRLLRRVRHPDIVLFFGVCVLRGATLGLILEWVEGMNLRCYTKSCNGWLHLLEPPATNLKAEDDEAVQAGPNHKGKLLLDVTKGMQFLHAQRPPIIHRDLKPANILVEMVAVPPRAKITDFGVSLLLRGDDAEGVAGTRSFMSPEILMALPFNASADVYSFGCTVCHTFVGTVVKLECLREVMAAMLERLDAPPGLVRLCADTVEETPSRRARFGELRNAFAEWQAKDQASDKQSNSTATAPATAMVTTGQ